MNLKIELSETDLRRLIKDEVERVTGQTVAVSDIDIKVKSKQNYKAEWETASFRAEYSKFIIEA